MVKRDTLVVESLSVGEGFVRFECAEMPKRALVRPVAVEVERCKRRVAGLRRKRACNVLSEKVLMNGGKQRVM